MNNNPLDIRIVKLAVEKTRQSQTAPGLRLMYLELSESPPHPWTLLFDQERAFPRHSMWRDARIEGRYIVVDCVPEELEKYHLQDLKQDVLNSNQKYVQWQAKAAAQAAQRAQKEVQERQRLAELGSRLKFD